MSDYLTDAHNDVQTYFETHEIPNYFYQCLFAELIKIFGVQCLVVPDENYLAEYDDDGNVISSHNDNYSYKDQILYSLNMLSGTFGWSDAFGRSCEQCKLTQLHQDYKQMDWVRSDIFDGYIVDRMVVALFDENYPKGYHQITYGV